MFLKKVNFISLILTKKLKILKNTPEIWEHQVPLVIICHALFSPGKFELKSPSFNARLKSCQLPWCNLRSGAPAFSISRFFSLILGVLSFVRLFSNRQDIIRTPDRKLTSQVSGFLNLRAHSSRH